MAAPSEQPTPRVRLSEGVREELARLGHTNDPATGSHLAIVEHRAVVISHTDCPHCAVALREARRGGGQVAQ
jgi:hypothetical protein